MLCGDGNENGQNKIRRSTQEKNNFEGCSTISFFVHFFVVACFARLQRETSRNLIVTRLMDQMSYVFLCTFFTVTDDHFHLGGRQHFSFSHCRYKIFMFFSLPTRLVSFVFFISRSSFFSVIHINKDIEIQSKERIGFVVVVLLFFLRIRVAMPKRATGA